MVDLVGHKNRLYRTKIEDMVRNGLYLIGVPRHGGKQMPLNAGDDVFMIFYRETGRFITLMNVVGLEKRGEIRYAWLFQKSEPYKDQRRDAFRVQIILDVSVYDYAQETGEEEPETRDVSEAAELENVSSRDISVSGISLITKNEHIVGGKRLLKVYVYGKNDDRPPFITLATVARCASWRGSGKNHIGLRFSGLTGSKSEFISKFVLEEQRRQLRKKRFVEGGG